MLEFLLPLWSFQSAHTIGMKKPPPTEELFKGPSRFEKKFVWEALQLCHSVLILSTDEIRVESKLQSSLLEYLLPETLNMAESILMAYGLLTDEQLMEMDETSIKINISEQDEKVLLETAENYKNECEIQNTQQQQVATTSKHYGQRKEKKTWERRNQ